ncbi:hypothetical protein EI42_03146 [Thermosporothrix hazakensis]|jgi:hypothetical protein|uniref:Uncharacterized protein n=1 Tax=Thermosporothrix hazakensis TaxID=644383 RepID=A0A326U551_THEHA|nr:hypothetical protein EI42_03146 [Thermosporothrix hazakensis]GCE45172.1 hypothetical protein KTH_00410 [Thermosporothrix hazakensis]
MRLLAVNTPYGVHCLKCANADSGKLDDALKYVKDGRIWHKRGLRRPYLIDDSTHVVIPTYELYNFISDVAFVHDIWGSHKMILTKLYKTEGSSVTCAGAVL